MEEIKPQPNYLDSLAIKYGFDSWIEMQKYRNAHTLPWYQRNPGKSCLDSEFLQNYLENKNEYFDNLTKLISK